MLLTGAPTASTAKYFISHCRGRRRRRHHPHRHAFTFHTKNASPTPNSRPILIPFYLFGRMYVQICEILKLWAN